MTLKQLRTLTEPGRYPIAPTLALIVQRSGSKSWVQSLRINGRRHNLGLGSFDALTPGQAKRIAAENRAKVLLGVDVLAEKREARRQAGIPTLTAACDAAFAAMRGTWKTERNAAAWRNLLANHAERKLGRTRVDQITRAQIVETVTALHNSGSEDAARRLAQNLRKVFAWAEANGHVPSNTVEKARGAFPKPTKRAQKNHAMIGHERIAEVYAGIDPTNRTAALALRLIILTGCRSGEIRNARWDWLDGDVLTVPAEHTKMGREHSVPLSAAALAIIEDARQYDNGSGLIFPSAAKGTVIGDSVILRLLRRTAGDSATVHGFRATFRSWAAEIGARREVAEAVLAHFEGGVEGRYQRHDYMDARAALLDRWAQYVTGERAKVVSIAA